MTKPAPVDDLIRATLHARVTDVHEVGPLRLPAAPVPRSADRRPRGRRWGPRLVPLAAAAVIIGVAIALVTVKSVDTPAVSPPRAARASSASSAAADKLVPHYYVAAGWSDLVVGDTYTGKTVATLPDPHGIVFDAVTAAADDRTFVLDAQPATKTDNGSRTWYVLRIAPGSADPARLTKLPIPLMTESNTVYALALSASGQELAVLTAAPIVRGVPNTGVLRIYSVATGALLHSWQTQHFGDGITRLPGTDETTALVWTANDTAIAFMATATPTSAIVSLRLFDLRSASGVDWVSAGRTVLTRGIPGQTATSYPCYILTIIPDGTGVACATQQGAVEAGKPITVRWLEYTAASPTTPRVMGEERYVPEPLKAASGSGSPADLPLGEPIGVYWSDPAGNTLLVAAGYSGPGNFGIAHDGTFTRLPAPVSSTQIAW